MPAYNFKQQFAPLVKSGQNGSLTRWQKMMASPMAREWLISLLPNTAFRLPATFTSGNRGMKRNEG